jgi:hypothetical protein
MIGDGTKFTMIPNVLSAESPRGLRRLMLLNNKRLNAFVNYQILFVNGRWHAWYYEDVTKDAVSRNQSKEIIDNADS